MKIRNINEHLREVELKTSDKDIRLGVLLDSEEPNHVQIYHKMFNPNPDEPFWERRMTSIELEIDMLEDIVETTKGLVRMNNAENK